MGRSRAASHATVGDDLGQSRSKRKRATNNVPSAGSVAAVSGIADLEKALYHCNYCNKDISGKIRVKCVICPDFDLCVECFSIGAEVRPHKSNHPYRVMDNLAFPLICPDWSADEEMLLLEGIEMYGLGNWNQVAEHVGTKNRSQCVYHYEKIYMNSHCFPLPDMSHVMGKSREDLLALAMEEGETKEGCLASPDFGLKEEVTFSPRIKIDNDRKEDHPARSSSSISSGSSGAKFSSGLSKRASDEVPGNDISSVLSKRVSDKAPRHDTIDSIKEEDRSIGEKKPRVLGKESVSIKELTGYNVKRQEFEIEYDNDAEQLLAEMEFKDTDTYSERDVKLRVLQIYARRLDERKRRKIFILERNLLHPDPSQRNFTAEELELSRQYRVFMRFHSKEDHDNLLASVVEHMRIVKRIQELQEARAAGCRTSAEARMYAEQKAKGEPGENARGLKENSQATTSGQLLRNLDHDVRDNWDISGFLGTELLSDAEKQLCSKMKILPIHYLDMLQTMSAGIMKGDITKKADAHELFHVDPEKVDEVYELLIRKGFDKD